MGKQDSKEFCKITQGTSICPSCAVKLKLTIYKIEGTTYHLPPEVKDVLSLQYQHTGKGTEKDNQIVKEKGTLLWTTTSTQQFGATQ